MPEFYDGQQDYIDKLNEMYAAFAAGPYDAVPKTGGTMTGPLTLEVALDLASGGTGATDAEGARIALDVVSKEYLASPDGTTILGYLAAAGLESWDVAEWMAESIRLFDFILKSKRAAIRARTSTYDASADVARCISFCNALPEGTEIELPRGKVVCNSSVPFKNNVYLRGKSKVASVIEFTHTGHGFVSTNTINTSTAAYIGISDATIRCTNAENTGGGFYDTASSYIDLERVKIQGFNYGIIFDQSEHAHVDTCELKFNKLGGIWLVNGPTLTPGVSPGFTNLINVDKCQFNATGIGIIDDGGGNHSFTGSNFNGGQRAFRFAASGNVRIASCSAEYSVDELVLFAETKSDGTPAGASGNITFDTVGLIASNDKHPILIEKANSMVIQTCYFETQATGTTKSVVSGAALCANLTTIGNKWAHYTKMLDSVPLKCTQLDADGRAFHSASQFYATAAATLPLETYCPLSTGGGSSLGGIALSANNIAGAKVQYAAVRPAITANTAGAESGALNIELVSSGSPMVAYIARVDSFRPGTDNTQAFGGPANRPSVIYAGTSTINTSDEREKDPVTDIADAIIRAIRKVEFKQFKFSDAVLRKGDAARWHFGVIAQQVKAAFESEGLDPFEYGVLCYDEWDAVDEVKDENGHVISPAVAAGNRYGIRYDELLCLKMAAIE